VDSRFVVVVTLALGVGANAALFSILDRLYWRAPAGVKAPEELFRLYRHHPPRNGYDGYITDGFPYPAVANIAGALSADEKLATYGIWPLPFGRGESALRAMTIGFGPGYFELLDVTTAVGRLPFADETRVEDAAAVALIGHAEWQRRFGGDPDVIGRTIELRYKPYTIIGVLPRGFTGLDVSAADYWIPLGAFMVFGGRPLRSSWNYGGTHAIVRGEPETRERVAAAATAVVARGAPPMFAGTAVSAGPLAAARGPHDKAAELGVATRLAAVAATLLLIACANVANLNLARGARRRQEIAVRLALGISRARLIAMLIVETLLLALLAGAAALLVASWVGAALRRTLFPDVAWHGSPLDTRVALFAAIVAIGAGLLAGVPPALRAARFGLANALKAGARDGDPRSRLRAGLVSVQLGLSVVLLIAAGAFIKSLRTASRIDVGFDAERLVRVTMTFTDDEEHAAELRAVMPRVIERLRALPQVEQVAAAGGGPLYEFISTFLFDEAGEKLEFARDLPSYHIVSPEFFTATGIRLVQGRLFTGDERDPAAPTIVVNRTMAANLWPGRSPLDQCLRIGKAESPCARVVGVVEPVHRMRLIEPEPVAHFYRSLLQSRNPVPAVAVVRVRPGELAEVVAAARALIRQALPPGALPSVEPLTERFVPELRPWRLGATLFSTVGALALLVATIGTYSVVSYLVQQRRHEVGVRMALGARADDIAQLVVTDALRMAGVGLVLGVIAAFALGRLIESSLYETSPRDPVVTGVVASLLIITAGIAALLPALRATRVDPTVALRAD
jgi:predicted permease